MSDLTLVYVLGVTTGVLLVPTVEVIVAWVRGN